MEKIKMEDFLIRQPGYPKREESDGYYLETANILAEKSAESVFGAGLPFQLVKRMALAMTGYLQDIVADGGIWRSFVDANRELYGWSVPFHDTPEEYVDYELNREDVRFLTWYVLAMCYEQARDICPHDAGLLELADAWFEILESRYDDAPEPEGYHVARGLDLNDPEDREEIYHLGQWLFLHCYLTTPAFAMSLGSIMGDPELLKPENVTQLHERLEQSMMEDPTGPLALFIPEWVYLIINGRLMKSSRFHEETVPTAEDKIHPYYEAFTKATGGKEIAYFDTYEKMNDFFINALGWDKGTEHLPMMKTERDSVLMVNRQKGMLAARDVARCIADPENPYYDKEYARTHAFDLLTVRGLCPGDLLRRIFRNNWLPDARFPGTDNTALVAENRDFIARCYLQQYYRGD